MSKSGYYKWLSTADEPDKDYGDHLIIKKIFDTGRHRYGFRTICMKLTQDKGVTMNHKKVIRIMRKYNMVTTIRRRNPYKQMAQKTKEHRTCENKLNRVFTQETPFHFFGTDITYIFFGYRPAYLSVVKDIASGEIVAWELSRHIDMDLVLNTIHKMPSCVGALIHSDQGVQYTSPQYIQLVKDMNMVQSMSRKGNCIDNAPTESFFGHLKDDVDYKGCKSFKELMLLITEYIEYYNTKRYQWDLKKMTPVQYRNHLLAA